MAGGKPGRREASISMCYREGIQDEGLWLDYVGHSQETSTVVSKLSTHRMKGGNICLWPLLVRCVLLVRNCPTGINSSTFTKDFQANFHKHLTTIAEKPMAGYEMYTYWPTPVWNPLKSVQNYPHTVSEVRSGAKRIWSDPYGISHSQVKRRQVAER